LLSVSCERVPGAAGDSGLCVFKADARYCINFAASGDGDPNGEGLVHWPAYEGTSERILGLGNSIGVVEYDLSRFEFIQGFRTNGMFPASWATINVTAASH
jgi:hypothetical protein